MRIGYYIIIVSMLFFLTLSLIEFVKIIFINDLVNLFPMESVFVNQQKVFFNEGEGILKVNFDFVIDSVNYHEMFVYDQKKIELEYPEIYSTPLRVCYNKLFPGFNYVVGFKNSHHRFLALSIYLFLSVFFLLGSKKFKIR